MVKGSDKKKVGRPAKESPAKLKSHTLHVAVSEEMRNRLAKVARALGLESTAVVRATLHEFLHIVEKRLGIVDDPTLPSLDD